MANKEDTENPFLTLGPTAELIKRLGLTDGQIMDVVRKDYRFFAERYYPDKPLGKSEEGQAFWADVQRAYDELGDPTLFAEWKADHLKSRKVKEREAAERLERMTRRRGLLEEGLKNLWLAEFRGRQVRMHTTLPRCVAISRFNMPPRTRFLIANTLKTLALEAARQETSAPASGKRSRRPVKARTPLPEEFIELEVGANGVLTVYKIEQDSFKVGGEDAPTKESDIPAAWVHTKGQRGTMYVRVGDGQVMDGMVLGSFDLNDVKDDLGRQWEAKGSLTGAVSTTEFSAIGQQYPWSSLKPYLPHLSPMITDRGERPCLLLVGNPPTDLDQTSGGQFSILGTVHLIHVY